MTTPNGIDGHQTGLLFGRFVVSRVVVSKSTYVQVGQQLLFFNKKLKVLGDALF